MWQDQVIAAGQWFFVAALLPSILDKDGKPSLWTSASTAVILTIFGGTFLTLDMKAAGYSSMASALAWWILFFQKL